MVVRVSVCVLREFCAHGNQKKTLDPTELELQMAVSYPVFRVRVRKKPCRAVSLATISSLPRYFVMLIRLK